MNSTVRLTNHKGDDIMLIGTNRTTLTLLTVSLIAWLTAGSARAQSSASANAEKAGCEKASCREDRENPLTPSPSPLGRGESNLSKQGLRIFSQLHTPTDWAAEARGQGTNSSQVRAANPSQEHGASFG